MGTVLTALGLIIGFALLIKGSDIFVDASVNIARKLEIPNVVIGLTIVTLGTGAPEIVISVSAAIGGSSDMAVGNIVGSNILNLMLILGLCALIKPIAIKLKEIVRDHMIGTGSAVLLLVLKIVFSEVIPRLGSFVLLSLFAVYMTHLVRQALKNRGAENSRHDLDATKNISIAKSILLVVLGIIIIVAGGQLAVTNAVSIAFAIGMTERVVGLTILAIGTSLPELVTSITACKKGESDIAIGNVIGSSIFNILFILGITGVIMPLAIDHNLIFDLIFLVVGSLVFLPFAYTGKKISRTEGLLMVVAYVVYMVFVTTNT